MKRRRLGVIGTFVWDEIHGRDARTHPVQEWGGIAYSLGALDAALDDSWEIVPLVKVGADLSSRAREFLRGFERLSPDAALIEVPQRNNRVVLRYLSDEMRSEEPSGGVPAWSWLGLKPLLYGLDALYINMISGVELDLETAQLLRLSFAGPIYGDLHSLLVALQPDGLRGPAPLPQAIEWCNCFDIVQMNEGEMALISPEPMAFASQVLEGDVSCLVVTLGARGAVYFSAAGFDGIGTKPPASDLSFVGQVRTALVPARVTRSLSGGDPTGCGDVFGATYFSRLLCGDNFATALDAALDAAGRNVEHRGAGGLSAFLRGRLSNT